MTFAIKHLRHAIGRPKRPTAIGRLSNGQERRHILRLCDLGRERPRADDLLDFADDLLYGPEVRPEDILYLLPVCLWAWRDALMNDIRSDYGTFSMNFSLVIQRDGWRAGMEARHIEVVRQVVEDGILAKIESQDGLRFHGQAPEVSEWIDTLGTYAIGFDGLDRIWTAWWRIDSAGKAIALLQYAATLIYGEDENPIFEPWTPQQGGGPPCLWDCTALLNDNGWRPENVAFLKDALSPDAIREALSRAGNVLADHPHRDLPGRMAADMNDRLELLSERLECLPILVASGDVLMADWPSGR